MVNLRPNIGLEPSRLTVCAIMSRRHAAQAGRSADSNQNMKR